MTAKRPLKWGQGLRGPCDFHLLPSVPTGLLRDVKLPGNQRYLKYPPGTSPMSPLFAIFYIPFTLFFTSL